MKNKELNDKNDLSKMTMIAYIRISTFIV